MDNEFDPELFFQSLRDYKFPSLRPQRSRAAIADTEWYVEKAIRLYQIPDSDAEALMIAAPYEEPSVSWESVYRDDGDLIDAVEEVFGALSEDEQWLYHILVDVGLSLRFVARVLRIPKTTLARRRDELADKLRRNLLQHEAVWRKLKD
tara:strand:- start:917 stop:1363 length:447 start_codon:yes stop_codon:yes gene_type:complete